MPSNDFIHLNPSVDVLPLLNVTQPENTVIVSCRYTLFLRGGGGLNDVQKPQVQFACCW